MRHLSKLLIICQQLNKNKLELKQLFINRSFFFITRGDGIFISLYAVFRLSKHLLSCILVLEMNIFLTIVLISSVICKFTFLILLLLMIILFYLDSIEAGECQVHNRPDYLSLTSNKNDENSGRLTVSNFANNLQTLLGLSSDQVDKSLSKKKYLNFHLNKIIRMKNKKSHFFIHLVHLKSHHQRGYFILKDLINYLILVFH